MKKLLLLAVAILLVPHVILSQDFSRKYGKITDHELKMDSYDRDPDADAVFLYENTEVFYEWGNSFRLITEYQAKIKILTNEGTDWADIAIPYIDGRGANEIISWVDAVSYNLEDGKVEKTALKKNMIFREKTGEYGRLYKFSIPNVKAGTVIEFRYRKSSDFIWDLPDIYIQHSIPVIYSICSATIPEEILFNATQTGFEKLNIKRSNVPEPSLSANRRSFTYGARVVFNESEHMPAIKEESHVWNIDDFTSKIEFEVSGVEIPGVLYRSQSASWGNVNGALSNSDFSKYAKLNCPFKDEVAAIKARTSDEMEIMREIHRYVMSKVSWNERYTLIGEHPRTALKDGSGSSAAINFLIMSGLNEAGINAIPIMLNPRSYGRIPVTRATIEKINTIVIQANTSDGNLHYIDGTDKYSDIDVLPLELIVDRARVYSEVHGGSWVDLTKISNYGTRANVIGVLGTDGKMEVKEAALHYRNAAMMYRQDYTSYTSRDEFLSELERKNEITVLEHDVQGLEKGDVTEETLYTEQQTVVGDEIFLRASIIKFMEENILPEQERKLPVEFAMPQQHNITCTVQIPEGYEVIEVPTNVNMTACDEAVKMIYMTQVNPGVINIRFSVTMNRTVYSVDQYDELRTFFGLVSEKMGSKFHLKKKSDA